VFSIVCVLSLALLRKVLDVHRGVVTHTQMHTHARTLDSLSRSRFHSLSLSGASALPPPVSLSLSISPPLSPNSGMSHVICARDMSHIMGDMT
jgi:hypothetical protein